MFLEIPNKLILEKQGSLRHRPQMPSDYMLHLLASRTEGSVYIPTDFICTDKDIGHICIKAKNDY